MEHIKKITVSPSIVWWTVGIALGLWFIFVIKEVIILFFIALVLSAAIDPAVRRLSRKKFPRVAAVSVIYIALLAVLAALLSYLIPAIISQAQDFLRNLPSYIRELTGSSTFVGETIREFSGSFAGTENADSVATGNLSWISQGLFSTTLGVFQGFVSLFAVLAIAFYMSVVQDGVARFLRSITPKKYQEYVISRALIVYNKIGHWMLGQIMVMVIVFVLYYIVLSLLGIPNALVLALFGGLLEIIPYIGPTVAAIPAVILGFIINPWIGVLVVISYVLIQQLENHILVPQIMKKAVGLNPIVVILALLIGAQIAGVLGMILSVPVAMALDVFVQDVLKWKGREENGDNEHQMKLTEK